MGFDLREAFASRHELKNAWLDEREFADTARALKLLACELGQDNCDAINAFAMRGLDAALGILAQQAGNSIDADFQRCRASLRMAAH